MPSESAAQENASTRPALSEVYQDQADLTLHGTFYPLGFPLRISTNNNEVLEAARLSWHDYAPLYATDPLSISLKVNHAAKPCLARPPHTHIEGYLLTIWIDSANFIVSDLRSGQSYGQVSPSLLESPQHLRYYFIEAAALSMISALRAVALHAACVELEGKGILLCGESGAGKSSLAYACARAGWNYISDDASYLILGETLPTVTGNCHNIRFRDSAPLLFPELQSKSITPRIAGKPSIEINTRELAGMTKANTTQISSIVFLNRKTDSVPGLRSISSTLTEDYFSKDLLLTSHENSLITQALARLARQPAFEMRYTELDWAIERMQQLVLRGT